MDRLSNGTSFFLIDETKTSRDVHTVKWRITATASDELTEFDEHVTDTTVWQSRNDTPVIWPASQVDISSSDCDFLYRITRTSDVAAMKYSDIKPTLYRSSSLLWCQALQNAVMAVCDRMFPFGITYAYDKNALNFIFFLCVTETRTWTSLLPVVFYCLRLRESMTHSVLTFVNFCCK